MNDVVSNLLRLIVGALGASHPIRLFIGVSSGLTTKVAISVLSSIEPDILALQTLNSFDAFWYILIITPWFFASIVLGKRGAPEAAVHQANTLQMLVEQVSFSAVQRRMFWHSLIDKYLKAARPDFSRQPNLESLAKETIAELEKKPRAAGASKTVPP